MADGSYAMVLYNPAAFDSQVATVTDWSIIGWPAGSAVRVREIIQHQELGNLTTYSAKLRAHQVSMIRVWQN